MQENGIVGAGGAGFPAYAKLDKRADTIILNCAECEPFITANHRLLLENPTAVINGVKILLKALGVRCAYIAVEDNKMDAVHRMKELLNTRSA